MSFLANESLIFTIYLKFLVQRYITCHGFFAGEGEDPKTPHFHPKNGVTLNITRVKYTIDFQMSFMFQTNLR